MISTTQLARVESEADPRRPGRTGYVITGATWGAVQAAISTLEATVDPTCGGACGLARFLGPISVKDSDGWCWQAIGEVLIDQPELEVA